MSTIAWIDVLAEFYEVCIHTLLYARGIYPAHIFDQRRYLGVTVWQSRHPEVNGYVRRVLENAKPLLAKNLVDRVVFVVKDARGEPFDHVTMKCNLLDAASSSTQLAHTDTLQHVEEELRSAVLKLCMTDVTLTQPVEDCSWELMVITRPSATQSEEELVKTSLTSGEWIVDNNQIPQNIANARRSQSSEENSPMALSSSTSQSAAKLKPIKSFRDEQISLSIYAHIFHS